MRMLVYRLLIKLEEADKGCLDIIRKKAKLSRRKLKVTIKLLKEHYSLQSCLYLVQNAKYKLIYSNLKLETYTAEKSKCFFPKLKGSRVYKTQEIIVHHCRNNLKVKMSTEMRKLSR